MCGQMNGSETVYAFYTDAPTWLQDVGGGCYGLVSQAGVALGRQAGRYLCFCVFGADGRRHCSRKRARGALRLSVLGLHQPKVPTLCV